MLTLILIAAGVASGAVYRDKLVALKNKAVLTAEGLLQKVKG